MSHRYKKTADGVTDMSLIKQELKPIVEKRAAAKAARKNQQAAKAQDDKIRRAQAFASGYQQAQNAPAKRREDADRQLDRLLNGPVLYASASDAADGITIEQRNDTRTLEQRIDGVHPGRYASVSDAADGITAEQRAAARDVRKFINDL